MNENPFVQLVHNAALLLTMAFLFDVVASRWRREDPSFWKVPVGLVIGTIGLSVMVTPWSFGQGIVFDTRSVLLGISGLFFGSIPTAIAMGMTMALRFYQGGAGAWTGAAVILASGLIGISWRHFRRRPLNDISWIELYLFGIAIHLAMLLLMLTLPWGTAMRVLASIALPVMLIYPVGTALLGVLMVNRMRRNQVDEALQRSESQLSNALNMARLGHWELDIARGMFTFSDSLYAILHTTAREMGGYEMPIDEYARRFVHPDDAYRVREETRKALETKDPAFSRYVEHRILFPDGSIGHVAVRFFIVKDQEGKTIKTYGVNQDITERKRGESALRESAERLNKAQEISHVGSWELDLSTKGLIWSDETYRIFGCEPQEFAATYEAFLHSVHPDDRDAVDAAYSSSLREGRDEYEIEHRVVRQHTHEVRHVHERCEHIRDASGRIVRSVGMVQDITERRRTEEALRESEERYQALFDQAGDGILILDTKGKILSINQSFANMHGFTLEEMLRMGLEGLDVEGTGPVPDRIRRIMGGETLSFEVAHYHKDGHIFPLAVTANLVSSGNEQMIITIHRDLTDLKRVAEEKQSLEERLQRAEKMESLGLLAGGVAHDLNNALGILVGYSELVHDRLDRSDPLRDDVRNIMMGGERAAAIVQDLLTLARRGVQTKTVVNINKTVTEYLQSPEHQKLISFYPTVRIRTELEGAMLKLSGSPVHLSKTLMNLVYNAAESMPSGGDVVIRTESRYLERPVSGYDQVEAGEYVVLTVSDEGDGIADEDIQRIFEPFYTKKVMGRSGTGLGLSVVWGTVKDHNGYIDVQSLRGKGTTFTLYFPVTREEVDEDDTVTPVHEYLGRGESLLVVDDVKEQRDLASRILSRLNYRVAAVSSGEAAVEYLKTDEADLIVLDMIMEPGMDGFETYRQITEIHPRQKAIIVTGFSETDRVSMAQALGAGACIKKPYISERIGLAVRKALDGK